MGATIIVGGQFGSEGKGKVTALEAQLHDEPFVVRCGGPNSGHTTNVGGAEIVLRQLPAAAGHPGATLFLSAGCAIDEQILLDEIDVCTIPRERIVVDPRAVLITAADKAAEMSMRASIASTASGTGAALTRRMARSSDICLAGSSPALAERARVESVGPLLHDQLDRGGPILVEGTQGFGLSLLHGPDYPYVTARDTTAAAFIMEAGLAPRDVSEIILVIRSFPIRVGGQSGALPKETTWDEVARLSGAQTVIPELTSVSRTQRRVAHFDVELVKAACRYNRPSALALMGVDRLAHANTGAGSFANLTVEVQHFLSRLAEETRIGLKWIGTGFGTFDAFQMNIPEMAATANEARPSAANARVAP